jgi:hypothetical protein
MSVFPGPADETPLTLEEQPQRALAGEGRGSGAKEAPPGFEPGMKVLQTSDQRDVKPSGENTSHFISERFSQPVPYNGPLPPDLAAVIEAWDRLPEAIKAGILAMVRTASGKREKT